MKTQHRPLRRCILPTSFPHLKLWFEICAGWVHKQLCQKLLGLPRDLLVCRGRPGLRGVSLAFDLARDLAEPLFSQSQDHAGEGARATQSNLATRPHLASKRVEVTG